MRNVRDPVHGVIRLRPVESALLETLPLQRLRRVRQLGLTHYVFPGAEHSRFTHSLGACHVAGQLGEALATAGWQGDLGRVRVAALLHDVGHPPFSHAGEQGEPHERTSERLIRSGEIADVLAIHGMDPEDVVRCFDARVDAVATGIVSGSLDADRMDYLLRDARMCGVSYGNYDLPQLVASVVPAPETQLGGGGLAVRAAGLHAAEGLVLARASMFLQVYFHRTRRLLDLLLEEVVPRWPSDLDAWLGWDDGRVLELLREDPRPAARALRDRRALPACVAEFEVTADPAQRAEAAALAGELERALGQQPRVDSSARLVAFKPAGDIAVVDDAGCVRSVFTASPVLRRMDPDIELRRIYVPREAAADARAVVERFRRQGAQMRLFAGR